MIEFIMDKRERRIMELLWKSEEDLGVSDIEKILGKSEKKLSKVSVFKGIQSLLDKKYIKVTSLERSGMVYARKYAVNISKEEYAALMLTKSGIHSDSLAGLVTAMVEIDKAEGYLTDGEEPLTGLNELIRSLKEEEHRAGEGQSAPKWRK